MVRQPSFVGDETGMMSDSSDSGLGSEWDIDASLSDDEDRGLAYKLRGGTKPSRLKCSIVFSTIAVLELWSLFQLVVFWQLFAQWSVLVSALVQAVFTILGVFGPFCCFLGQRTVKFPFDVHRRNIFQWYFFVASGILIGSLVAIIGGYSFGAWSILNAADFREAIRPDMAQPGALQGLEEADFVKFTFEAHVATIFAARKYSADKRHYYCSAPVMGSEAGQNHIFFFVTSNEGCCLTDDYACEGWDNTGFVARVVQQTSEDDFLRDRTKKIISFFDDAAQQAAEASGVSAGFIVDPNMLLLQVTDEEPTLDAEAHFIRGAVVTLFGLALWPVPPLFAWAMGCK